MYKLLRSRYCTYREDYELELTDEYVAHINILFNSRTKNAYRRKIEITSEMILDAFQWNKNCSNWDCDIVIYYPWDKETPHTESLVEFILDAVDDGLCDSDYDTEFIDSYNTQDDVIEVK